MSADPFVISIPDERLEDLRRRLRSTNWPPDEENDDWRYGTNGRYPVSYTHLTLPTKA